MSEERSLGVSQSHVEWLVLAESGLSRMAGLRACCCQDKRQGAGRLRLWCILLICEELY
jgi:hypothetical protein